MCANTTASGRIRTRPSTATSAMMLKALDQHFAENDFLLGTRPCLADFALAGAMQSAFCHRTRCTLAWQGDCKQMMLDYTWNDCIGEQTFDEGVWLPRRRRPRRACRRARLRPRVLIFTLPRPILLPAGPGKSPMSMTMGLDPLEHARRGDSISRVYMCRMNYSSWEGANSRTSERCSLAEVSSNTTWAKRRRLTAQAWLPAGGRYRRPFPHRSHSLRACCPWA